MTTKICTYMRAHRGGTGFVQQNAAELARSLKDRERRSLCNAIEHSANPDLDNCYRDYAQQNARELAGLLTS